jgi:DNA-binding MarR family transcriptional regulator
LSTVVVNPENPEKSDASGPLGPALRRAWVGYQQQLDAALAAAGFDDRRFPDGRVLRLCRDHPDTTVSQIGRALGITRQGASKVVAGLHERGYVTLAPSPTSGREKTVSITAHARDYLAAQRRAARSIDRRLRRRLGDDAVDRARLVLDALAPDDARLRDYLRTVTARER